MASDTPVSSHDFSIKKLEDSCKRLCWDEGFMIVSAPAMSKLTAILRSKLEDYAEGTRLMMESASRTKPIVTDVTAALKLKGVKMPEIIEYAEVIKSESLRPCSLPLYPAPDPDATKSDDAYFQAMYGPPPSVQELQQRPDHIPPYSRAIHSEFDMEKVKKEENAPSPSPQSSKKHKKQKKASVFPNLEDMDFEQSGLYKVYEDNRRFMEYEARKENAYPLAASVKEPVPVVVKPAPVVQPVAQLATPTPVTQPAIPTPTTRAPLKIKIALPPRVPDTSPSSSGPLVPAVQPLVSNTIPLSPLVVPPAIVPIAPRPAVTTPRILKRRGRPLKVEKETPSAQKQESIHPKVLGFLKKDMGSSLFSSSPSSSIFARPVFTSSLFPASSKDIPSSNIPMVPDSAVSKDTPSSSSCPPKEPEILKTSQSSSPHKDIPSTSCNPPPMAPDRAPSKDVPSSSTDPPTEPEILEASNNGEKEKKPKRDKNSEEYKEYKRLRKERKRREKEERRQREQESEPQPQEAPLPKLKLRIKFGNDNLPTSSSFVEETKPERKEPESSPEAITPLRIRIKFDGSKKKEDQEPKKEEEPKKVPPRRLLSTDDEEEDDEVLYICPVCSVAYNHAANMVSCDKCEEWFHWHCVGITSEPTEEQWFCKKCSKSMKKSKKRAGGAATSDLPAKRKKR
ncbi:hypothetical protein CAEBREN_19314 [Caenorhabditis brenneri]|uniref:PHD-type domain-containing protein n=1 Tax=Caenorhabditis brenneri TaxID=135651 RepID=G0MMM5_CAEBE|nr:hypothetical protein CAEBREN_19314 [Caenorhabditis brenneri]